MGTHASSWNGNLSRSVTHCRRLVTPCLLAAFLVTGIAAVSRASTGDPPASLPGLQPFDVGAATHVLADATPQESTASPPFVGLATRITVDPLFGTATTTIPIELPPARLTPDLSVRYSSNGSNGLFGLGWTLGLGSITRNSAKGVPLAHDGSGNYDIFAGLVLNLHGTVIQLDTCMSLYCTDWAASAEETWVSVHLDYSTNIWQVTDKAGTVYTFGGTPGARTGMDVRNDHFAATYAWFLTSVTDVSGNTIQITYQAPSLPSDPGSAQAYPNANTYAYPDTIDYGGNWASGVQQYANIFHVKFGYDEPAPGRPDRRLSFQNGFPEQIIQRVTSVRVWADWISMQPPIAGTTQSNPTRRYTFAYIQSPDNGVSLLQQVAETVANGTTSPPPTTFSYSTGAHGLTGPSPVVDESGYIQIPAFASSAVAIPPDMNSNTPGLRDWADVHGDGLPDLINAAVTSLTSPGTDLYRNLGGGKFRRIVNWNTSQVPLSTWDDVRRFFDLTGDGLPDAVQSNTGGCPTATGSSPVGPTTATCAWKYYANTGGSLAAGLSTWGNVPQDMAERFPGPSYNWGNWRRMTAQLIDLNGDGRPDNFDCWYQMGGTINCNVYWNTGSGFSSQPTPWLVPAEPTSDLPASGGLYDPPGGLLLNWTPLYRLIRNDFVLPSQTIRMIVDMNGDGLPDYVNIPIPISAYGCGYGFCYLYQVPQTTTSWDVYFNTGQGFAPTPIPWSVPAGAPISATYPPASNYGPFTNGFLRDMNGDGLPDYATAPMYYDSSNGWVVTSSNWQVSLNTGSGFASPVEWAGTGWLVPNHTQSTYAGYWTTDQLLDVNGDGLPDQIRSTGSEIDVRYGSGQRPNLLVSQTNGLGGSYAVTYAAATDPAVAGAGVAGCSGGTNDSLPCDSNSDCPSGTCVTSCPYCSHLPFPTWVAQSVTEHSGVSGTGNDLTAQWKYVGGTFDTVAREFRGFRRSVETRAADGRAIQRTFAPAVAGQPFKPIAERISDGTGQKLRETTTAWGTQSLGSGRVQVHPTNQVQTMYGSAGLGTPKIVTQTFDSYDTYNNVTSQTVTTNDTNPTVPTVVTLTDYFATGGCHSQPTRMEVRVGSTALSSKNVSYTAQCNPLLVQAYLAPAGQSATTGTLITTTEFRYDATVDAAAAAAGQPTKILDANGNSTRLTYGCSNGLFPCTITNALTQTTTKNYDLQWGKATSITPPNGSPTTTKYTYDGLGRFKAVVRPLESQPAQQFAYAYGSGSTPSRIDSYSREPNATLAGPDGNAGYRLVSTFYDSLGRKLETKRGQYVGGIATGVISEAVTFDGAGRVATTYIPKASASGIAPANLQTYEPVQGWFGTSYLYDAMDRVIRTTNSDYTYRTVDYSYAGQTTTLDENYNAGSTGSKVVETFDALGRVTWKDEYTGPTPLTEITQTKTQYDGLGRVWRVTVTDYTKNPTVSASTTFYFDSFSRKTRMDDPDSGSAPPTTPGTWTYGYDNAGNLIYQDDPKSAPSNPPSPQHLEFCYDQLNRVKRKLYFTTDTMSSNHATLCAQNPPAQPYIDYFYDANATYGCSSADIGYLCRVDEHRTDANSTRDHRLTHDARGHVAGESIAQTITVNGVAHSGSFAYQYAYDAADRLWALTYPTSTANSSEGFYTAFNDLGQLSAAYTDGQTYVGSVKYDIFGRVGEWTAGSGVVNTAIFGAWNTNFRLQDLRVANSGGSVYQQFDYIDNGGLGYDGVGNLKGFADNTSYAASLKNAWTYQYDGLARLTSAKLNTGTPVPFTYDGLDNMTAYGALAFTPTTGTHHTASSTGSQTGDYKYDDNGALTRRPDTDTGGPDTSRTITYDIDGRVATVNTGDGHTIQSVYNFRGERIARIVDGSTLTFYYGRWFDVTGATLTRHMYLGNRLIADSPVTAPSGLLSSLQERDRQTLFASVGGEAVITGAGVYPVAALTQVAAVTVGSGVLILCIGLAFAPGRVRLAYLGKVHRGRIALVILVFVMATSPLPYARPAWGGGGGSYPTYPVYFIHGDHLGSTTMLTCYKQSNCSDGAVARYYRYDAYGQPTAYDASGNVIAITTALSNGYIPERLYTGQRWDWRARLYYYGARFYDPKIANFLTLDPARQYVNPYAYVGWNPVMRIDPTGMTDIETWVVRAAPWLPPGMTILYVSGVELTTVALSVPALPAVAGAVVGLGLAYATFRVGSSVYESYSKATGADIGEHTATGGQDQGAGGEATAEPKPEESASGRPSPSAEADSGEASSGNKSPEPPKTDILQSGGHTISKGTARALNESSGNDLAPREWGRAVEALKKENGLRNDFQGKITRSGDYMDRTGKVIDNIFNYIP